MRAHFVSGLGIGISCWARFVLDVVRRCAGAARARECCRCLLAGTMLPFMLAVALVGYVYVSLALQTIATKTSTQNGWLACIPIVNIFLMLDITKKPLWWFILFLIPLVNIVIAVIVWMGIAEARQRPNWWGILTIVPIANLVVPGNLAWAD